MAGYEQPFTRSDEDLIVCEPISRSKNALHQYRRASDLLPSFMFLLVVCVRAKYIKTVQGSVLQSSSKRKISSGAEQSTIINDAARV